MSNKYFINNSSIDSTIINMIDGTFINKNKPDGSLAYSSFPNIKYSSDSITWQRVNLPYYISGVQLQSDALYFDLPSNQNTYTVPNLYSKIAFSVLGGGGGGGGGGNAVYYRGGWVDGQDGAGGGAGGKVDAYNINIQPGNRVITYSVGGGGGGGTGGGNTDHASNQGADGNGGGGGAESYISYNGITIKGKGGGGGTGGGGGNRIKADVPAGGSGGTEISGITSSFEASNNGGGGGGGGGERAYIGNRGGRGPTQPQNGGTGGGGSVRIYLFV